VAGVQQPVFTWAYLAVGYYTTDCDDDWGSRGWYRLEPGQSGIVLYTTNDYSTFYAEADAATTGRARTA